MTTATAEPVLVENVEAFDGLSLNSMITVGSPGNIWAKTAEGWKKVGATVDFEPIEDTYFHGEVNQGRVSVGIAPMSGQLYEATDYHGYHYLLLEEESSSVWYAVRLADGVFSAVLQVRVRYLGALVTGPVEPWQTMAYAMGMQIVAAQRAQAQANTSRVEAQNSARVAIDAAEAEKAALKRSIETALHAYMAEHNVAGDGPLGDLLTANGMRRPDQMVDVRIAVRATKRVEIPTEVVQSILTNEQPREVSVVVPGYAMSTFEVTLTKQVEVEGGQCGCSHVSRGHIRTLMREEGIVFDDFAYTRSCPNDSGTTAVSF